MFKQELKLGCDYPVRPDIRNIKMSAVLGDLPIPPEYDSEVDLIGEPFPGRMWLNDTYGDCLVAMIANWTRILEYIEQGAMVNILDENVRKTYFDWTGGADNGLDMLDSFNRWRTKGWNIGGNGHKCCFRKTTATKQHLDIFAFATMDSADELRKVIYYLKCAGAAILIPQYAEDQFRSGEKWHVVNKHTEIKGGHAIALPHYLKNGDLGCWTWKKRQLMTEEFFLKQVYFTLGVVDGRDKFLKNSNVDLEKLNAILQQIKNS